MEKRILAGILIGAAAVLIAAASSPASSSGVNLRAASYPSLGSTILVDGSGRPLYHLISEKGKSIRCSGTCAKIWPPVILAKGTTAVAGPGLVRAKLGTIRRPDGRSQATYGGLALYRYAADRKGTAGGQGVGQVWYVIGATGRIITKKAADTAAGTDMGGSTGGTTTTGGDTGGEDPGGGPSYGY